MKRANSGKRTVKGFTPLFWYLLITIVVPFLNNAHAGNTRTFFPHVFTVLCVSGLVLLFLFVIRKILFYLFSFFKKIVKITKYYIYRNI